MMAHHDFDWTVTPLDDVDACLADAYERVGRPLDDLAYTADFDRMLELAGWKADLADKHEAFRRLMNLRKRGRLPRITRSASADAQQAG